MKGDLQGAFIGPLNVCDVLTSSGPDPFPSILQCPGPWLQKRGSVSCALLFQAEEFRDTVHMLLEWLSEAEQTLRFRGALPDDTEALHSLIDTHKVIQPHGNPVTCTTHHGEGCPTTKGKQLLLGNFRPCLQRNRNGLAGMREIPIVFVTT